MELFQLNSDEFNPQVYYVSYEYYNSTNILESHMHPFPVIMFVEKLSGSCTYVIDGDRHDVRAGDVYLINPGIYHRKLMPPGAEINEVHLAFDRFHISDYPENHLLYPATYARLTLAQEYQADFRRCVDALISDEQFERPLGELFAKSLLLQLFVIAFRCFGSNSARRNEEHSLFVYNGNSHDRVVSALREYLIENYQKNISLSVVAGKMFLSQEYLSRIFKAEIGKSPYTFLTEIRLNKARDLLENTQLSIAQVASHVGYTDVYHFSKLFKKYCGMAPMSYRKNVQTGQKSAQLP